MKSSATPFRALGKPAVAAFCMVCVTCVLTLALKSQNLRAGGTPALARDVLSQAHSNRLSASRVAGYLGALPLAFEPNQGQSSDGVKYIARGTGYTVFFTPSETVLVLGKSSSTKRAGRAATHPSDTLRMSLVGADASADFIATDQLPGKTNYLIGPRANWHTSIPNFRRISQRQVYPGIDISYHGTEGQLEEDFVVSPGTDPRAIRLAFEGARTLRTNSDRELLIGLAGGAVTLRAPVAYQESNGSKHLVSAKFVVLNNRRVGFRLGEYDQRLPLVIDPVLSYSTYLGGSNIDGANAIGVASDNTAFVAGGTFSTDFPTAHPLQPNHGGSDDFYRDAFVAKLSADGSTLLYSTYLGGKNEDVAYGIAVDFQGDAYVVGLTLSPDFPVTPGSLNTLCGGDGKCGASFNPNSLIVSNGFIAKLNPEGSALVYSGFIGNYENVIARSVAVDANNVAYVTGQTEANGIPTGPTTPPLFPITSSAYQPAFGGGVTDAFVMKISATGTTILYSSYLGGNVEDVGYGIAVDTNADAYVTGLTYSTNFPIKNGLQATAGGAGDAFFSEVNTNASGSASLLYSTYLGGAGLDQGNGIAVDTTGHAYIAGGTNSKPLPFATATIGPIGVEGNAFVSELDPTKTGAASLIYFTYLGGSLASSASGIAVDGGGNAYVTGSTVTVTTDFPTTAAVFQPKFGGGNADAFITKLGPGGVLVYSSYLGGSNTDSGYGIAVDSSGSAYVAGQTCSLDFPLSNPLQAAPGGNCDAFISKVTIQTGLAFNPAGLVFPPQSLGTTSQTETVTITNGDLPQTISNIAMTGANPSDFLESNNCVTSLAPGAQCTISVTFTPAGAGNRKASITITDSAPGSPQVVNLSGTTSTLTLSASTLAFGNQPIGVASSSQSIIATNNGTVPLTFTGITASGSFSETDNCTKAPLQPGTNCSINVVYTPSAPGSNISALTLTDNAPGSPQIVLLTGTGFVQPADFGISVAPSSATLSAGASAMFTVSVSSISGFAQPVTLSCSGLPVAASCSFSPSAVTPGASAPATSTLTIFTGLRTQVPLQLPRKSPPAVVSQRIPMSWLLCGIAIAALISLVSLKGRRAKVALGVSVLLAVLLVACANGGSTAGVPAGTPAGSNQVSVTGVSGTLTHSGTVSLHVN
jgi:hypothetical protein